MRKTSEEITREVFGQGSRWIGWENWLKHRVVFKYIMDQIQAGIGLGSRKSFYLRCRKTGGWSHDTMMKVNIDPATGELLTVEIPGPEGNSRLTVSRNESRLNTWGGEQIVFGEIFEDPWKPTLEELDLFQVLYGEEQHLIDMNSEFFGTIRQYDRTVSNGTIQKLYPE